MKAANSNGKISQEEIYRRVLAGIDEAFRRSETPEGREAAQEAYDFARHIINEHAALVAVAEAAQRIDGCSEIRPNETPGGYKARILEPMREALAVLAAARAGNGGAK